VIAYHSVLQGEFLCRVGAEAPVGVHPGQILLLPRNDEHHIGSSLSADPVSAHELILPPGESGLARISWGGGGDVAVILCGFLGTLTPLNSFMLSLPSLLVIDASAGAAGEWLASSIRYATRETLTGSPELVGKLAELLFIEAVRHYVDSLPEERKGWFGGLRDPHVSRAMALLHARYADAWTAEALAREVGVSRTVLNARFSHYVGEPPMRYLARWRMNLAASLLRERQQSAGHVAYAVGFNSEAAFNRAFKREFGLPPAAWRREKYRLN
jgi:AraC-like DNA-binding protein